MSYQIEFSPDAWEQLQELTKYQQRIVVDAIANQLTHQPTSDRTMKILDVNQATESLAEYVRAMEDEPIILMREGQPIFALVSLENVDLGTVSLSLNPQFIEIIEKSRARQKKEGGIS